MGWTDTEGESPSKKPVLTRRRSSVKDLSLKFERASTSSTEDSVSDGKDVTPSTTPVKVEKPVGLRDGKKGLSNLVAFFENVASKPKANADEGTRRPAKLTLTRKHSSIDVAETISVFDKQAKSSSKSSDDLTSDSRPSCDGGHDAVFSPGATAPEVKPGTVANAKQFLYNRETALDNSPAVTPERTTVASPTSGNRSATPRVRYQEFMTNYSKPKQSGDDHTPARHMTPIRTPSGLVAERMVIFSASQDSATAVQERSRVRYNSAGAVESTPEGVVGRAKRRMSLGARDNAKSETESADGTTSSERSVAKLRRRSSSSSDLGAIPGGIASKAKSQFLEEASKSKVKRSAINVYGKAGPSQVATASGLASVK